MRDRWWVRRSSHALVGGAAAAVAMWALGRGVVPDEAATVTDVAFTLAGTAAAVASLAAARHGREDERPAWLLIAAASAAWLVGQILWGAYAVLGAARSPFALPDAVFLAAAPLFIAGCVAFLVRAGQRLAVYALVLDVGAVVLTLLAALALLISDAIARGAAREPAALSLALLHPVLYVGATGAALSTLWGMPAARPRGAFALLATAMALDAASLSFWLPRFAEGVAGPGSVTDLGLVLAKVSLAAAALRALEHRDESVTSRLSREALHVSRLFLPGAVAVAAAYVLIASQLDTLTATDAIVAVGIALTVLLLAARAGLALFTNYRMSEQEHRRASQYEALYDVGLETAHERSVGELARVIVDRATDLTATDGSTLALAEPGRGYVIRALRKPVPALRDSIGEPLVGLGRAALEQRAVVAATDYAAHPASNAHLHDVIASAMSAPLIVRGEGVGVLTVYTAKRRTFAPATQRLFQLYAAQAANAIATARLLEESRLLARHDGLTGVLNRRSLMERLEAQIAESRRHGDAFCVVMCDLDGLKDVNDTAGHLVGDEVLRHVAEGLRTSARSEDTVARFGGDEFVLLLPRTSLLQGQALVARLGARLRERTYTWGGRAEQLPRVSIGISAFPDDGLTTEQLIAAADARMYADKSRARGIAISLEQA